MEGKVHMLEGDEQGQKFIALIRPKEIEFQSREIDPTSDKWKVRTFAVIPTGRILALADRIREEQP